MTDTEKEIQELQKKLAKLKAKHEKELAIELAEKYIPLYDLAEKIHSALCPYNHTDGCGWMYEESHDNKWERWAHAKYLGNLEAILEKNSDLSIETLEILIDQIIEFKKVYPKALWLFKTLREGFI